MPERERMDFRIGINLGDVMIDDHDIFGEGVNIASRLQSLATPGGILISGSVHDQVKNKLALGFNFMGHQQVKNISEQVPVFVVAHDVATALPIGAVSIGMGAPGTVMAPALMPLRIVAGVIDGLVASVLAFALAALLQGAVGPVFTLDAPFTWIANERTLSSDLPSLEIADGGESSRTTVRSIVERNYLGFVQQNYRRTATEIKKNGSTEVQIREALLDGNRGREISRPSGWMVVVVLYFVVLVLSEGMLLRGASPGKLLMGLRVSTLKGGKPGLFQAGVRNLSKVISIAPALLGIIMALFSKKRQMLHDVLTGCYVHDAK